jgi:hypothetical protein
LAEPFGGLRRCKSLARIHLQFLKNSVYIHQKGDHAEQPAAFASRAIE